MSLNERLLASRRIVDCGYITPCWLWSTIPITNYGAIKIAGIKYDTHILSAKTWLKNFNPLLMTLHKCNIKACFNPDHLYQGTAKDNVRDMLNVGNHGQQKKTHCINGHELILSNIRFRSGYRECKKCSNKRTSEYKKRKRLPH